MTDLIQPGRPKGPGGPITDASPTRELERCRDRLRNLKECFRVSGQINSTLELEEVLENIMTTLRGILGADACSLMLVDEQTEELVFEVAQGPVADRLKGGFRLKKGEGIAGHVFMTGEPQLIEDAYRDSRFHQDFDRRTGYKTQSILCVPLKVKDRVIGVSQVINKLSGEPFNLEDVETLTLLCAHAAIAVENARMHRALLRKQRIESDLAFATCVQQSFLPQDVPSVEGYRFLAHYKPALEVGGDFYDFIPLENDRLGILIGDVSGKGVAAALYMAKLTSDFRLLAIRMKEPARLVEQVNELLCEQSRRGMFVTLLYMDLNPADGSVSYVNAGHVPPVLWNCAKGEYLTLRDCSGPPLGIVPNYAYSSRDMRLRSGDCLLLSTDGLIEAMSPEGERFGWDRLKDAIQGGDAGIEAMYRRIDDSMRSFVGEHPAADDTTVVLLDAEGSR